MYIYSHPQTHCFIVSQLFNVARLTPVAGWIYICICICISIYACLYIHKYKCVYIYI